MKEEGAALCSMAEPLTLLLTLACHSWLLALWMATMLGQLSPHSRID